MAAEKAADLLLGPVVNITISKVIEQLDLAVGFKQELGRFREKLDMVRGVLQYSEESKLTGESVLKPWLKKLQSNIEEADDVMDEIAYENLRRKVAAQKHRLKRVSDFFTPSSNPCLVFRIKMANKIKDLNAGLDSLNKTANDLGLQHRLANFPEHRENQQITTSLVGDSSEVIRRDGDLEKIVQLLIGSSIEQRLCVVSVVGMAGIGKTTLAKLVCNNDQIQGHFFKIMWVCVSDNFDVEWILVKMLESLNKGSCGNISQDVVAQLIKEKLEEKNYLLILDDVWNDKGQKWEDLRRRLLEINRNNGSRVLVTGRSHNVALAMGTLPEHVHCLEQLEDDDCWSIISRRVLENAPIPSELETIGRENAKKCKGVPLVASVIGGVLCNNRNEDTWREVWDSIGEADEVLSVLQMSFSRLPKPALKQCFAFCSIFSKDFVMEKEMLIQLWMAHGFLQLSNERHMKMEDIGDEYFNYLLSCSLFQDAEKDSYGRVITCKMHDLIHDLAQSVSKSQTVILGNGSRGEITADSRHLNLISDEGMATTEIGDAMQKMHTLFSKINVFHNMPTNFKKVRVLSFFGAYVDKLPALLRKLKHLRYLDVSRTKIKELPEFITKLYQLQTLRFMDCCWIERPLKGIGNLVNLRHIYFNDEDMMPAGVGTLTCLQTLQLFVVGRQKRRQIEELGGLSQLKGKLKITNLKMVRNREQAEKARLLEKFAIQELELDFGKNANERDEFSRDPQEHSERGSEERRKHDEDVLEGLQPHSNLKSLRIDYYCGEKCASWMLEGHGNLGESTSLTNLVSLRFYDCPQLKSIPSLSLNNGAKVEIRSCNNLKSIAVSCLQELEICWCAELVSIEFGPPVMRSLKKLVIQQCDKLKSHPMFSGIGESLSTFTCLTELSISACGSLELVPSLDGLLSLQKIDIGYCHKLKSIGRSSSASTCLKLFSIHVCGSLELVSLDGLSSLQKIWIYHCQNLKSIGESLSASTCLKEFSMSSCDSLELVPSLDGLSSLQKIDIFRCGKLKSIGESLSASTCLTELRIISCNSLELVLSLDGLSSLQEIDIWGWEKLKSIGESLSASTCLKKLSIWDCANLEFFPSLDGLSSLQEIFIRECKKLKSIGKSLSTSMCLRKLDIRGCESLEFIPSLDGLSSLQEIFIWGCGKFKSIGESLSASTCLKMLDILECGSLEFVPSLQGLSSLQHLRIRTCDKLTSLPSGLASCTALKWLAIEECHNLISIQEDLRDLRSLDRLFITKCRKLRNILGVGEILGCPLARLKVLHFGGFSAEQEELEEFPIQLEELGLVEWEKLKHLPHQIQRVTALRKLIIEDFNGLEALPEWLGNLSSLQSLVIGNCKSLKYMEAIRCLSNLKDLEIWECPELRERCARESGSEWNNISHIPNCFILDGHEPTTELGLTFETTDDDDDDDEQQNQLSTWKRPFICCKA